MIKDFFYNSIILDRLVLRPLSHIRPNWELEWNSERNEYEIEDDSFAGELNEIIKELDVTETPKEYHDNEDFLAEYVKNNLKWPIVKKGKFWVGDDYPFILEQGGYGDFNEENLMKSAKGRITTAKKYGQEYFDDMEEGHRKILAEILTIIIYHRIKYKEN